MQTSYRGAFEFLSAFERELRARAAFRRYFTRRERNRIVEIGPYWSMFNVGSYTLASHKVVWKDIATDFAAAVVKPRQPVVLSAHTVMEVACASANEAHYLCGVLNSVAVRGFVAAYVATHISTHTVEYIHVPQFDGRSDVHRQIASASRSAHQAVVRGAVPDENAVDEAAAQLWDLTNDELDATRTFLDQLRKRDLVAA